LEVPSTSTKEPPRPDSYPIRFVSSEASGASRRFFYAVRTATAPVFENSAASVYVEKGRSRKRTASVDPVPPRHFGADFEHKLKVKRLSPSGGNHFFTESLILAQDERWRRA
jgi:hypothetical protein